MLDPAGHRIETKNKIIRSARRLFNRRGFDAVSIDDVMADAGSVVFDLDAGFDPYSFRFSNGAGSVAENAGLPQNQQLAWSDSSRAGQWYNGQG